MPHMIALSGGVDSSVALYLSKQKYGEGLCGVTLSLGGGSSALGESDLKNISDAQSVCALQNTQHCAVDASEEFEKTVKEYFARAYLRGETPNPCVICNSGIKFGLLMDYADKRGYDKIITGHYARLVEKDGFIYIKKAADVTKDQSYVLAMLTQSQLRRAEFPLGEYTKAEIRDIAEREGFVNARRKDSQDICFIPDGDYVKFITEFCGAVPEAGDYVDENGKILGKHKGHWCYTIGQRKGLGISMGKHVFVLSKDAESNRVVLGDEEGLFKSRVNIKGLHFPSSPDVFENDSTCRAKLRYSAREADAVFVRTGETEGYLEFEVPQRAPTHGQFAVMYRDDCVIAAGIISRLLPTE